MAGKAFKVAMSELFADSQRNREPDGHSRQMTGASLVLHFALLAGMFYVPVCAMPSTSPALSDTNSWTGVLEDGSRRGRADAYDGDRFVIHQGISRAGAVASTGPPNTVLPQMTFPSREENTNSHSDAEASPG